MRGFFEGNCVYTPWTEAEDEWLLRDWLVISSEWKVLAKRPGNRSDVQPKNRWYSVVRHCVHRYLDSPHELARVLDQGRRVLPVP
jgi:hypothetical protein